MAWFQAKVTQFEAVMATQPEALGTVSLHAVEAWVRAQYCIVTPPATPAAGSSATHAVGDARAEAVAQPTQGDVTATPAASAAASAQTASAAASAQTASPPAESSPAASAAASAQTASSPAESSPGATAASDPVQDRGDTDAAGITAPSTNIDELTDGLTEADLTFDGDETTAAAVSDEGRRKKDEGRRTKAEAPRP